MSGTGTDSSTVRTPATPAQAPLLEVRELGKSYGTIIALSGVNAVVEAGSVTCVLGDNGAGKSTLIKVLAGAHPHDAGQYLVQGRPVRLTSPRQALDLGISTVFQDLAVVPLMSVWRNFFLGSEPRTGFGPVKVIDRGLAKRRTRQALADMGIDLRDVEQPVGTLSGGERQCVAIARAVYFGARVLILDEPTAALGVKQAATVLRYVAQARDRGLGVVLITHNPHHAYPVGDRFLLLQRGRSQGLFTKSQIDLQELTRQMAGGVELQALDRELQELRADRPGGNGASTAGTAGTTGSVGPRAAGRRTGGSGG